MPSVVAVMTDLKYTKIVLDNGDRGLPDGWYLYIDNIMPLQLQKYFDRMMTSYKIFSGLEEMMIWFDLNSSCILPDLVIAYRCPLYLHGKIPDSQIPDLPLSEWAKKSGVPQYALDFHMMDLKKMNLELSDLVL